MFKIMNKTYQPLILEDGTRIKQRGYVIVKKMTDQIKSLEARGLVVVRKM